MHGILLPCLDCCSKLLLGIVRQVTNADMQNCCSFTCCLSWTHGSLSQCSQLKFFYRCYFGRCSFKLAQSVPLLYSQERSCHYSERLYHFSVSIRRCYKDVNTNSFFPHTAKLLNSLPIECFRLAYDLSGFKSRMNRHLLAVGPI